MNVRRLVAFFTVVFVLTASPAFAGAGWGVRLIPGYTFFHMTLGEGRARMAPRTGLSGLTLGGLLCTNRDARSAITLGATVPIESLVDLTGGGDWRLSAPLVVGYQGGRETYGRAGVGLVLILTRQSKGRVVVDYGFAAEVAVGRHFDNQARVGLEAVLRFAAMRSERTFSGAVQIPLGKCYF